MSSIPEELKKNLTIEDELAQAIGQYTYDETDELPSLALAMLLIPRLEAVGLKLVEIEK